MRLYSFYAACYSLNIDIKKTSSWFGRASQPASECNWREGWLVLFLTFKIIGSGIVRYACNVHLPQFIKVQLLELIKLVYKMYISFHPFSRLCEFSHFPLLFQYYGMPPLNVTHKEMPNHKIHAKNWLTDQHTLFVALSTLREH